MQDLRISLVQGATRWHDPAGNRAYYAGLVAPLRGATDLVLLPETFTSGFSNEAIHNAETMDGPTIENEPFSFPIAEFSEVQVVLIASGAGGLMK